MADKSSASGSDSEPNLTDWTVIDGHGDVEGSETSSTSSSLEFVHLEENAAVFQRKEIEQHRDEIAESEVATSDVVGHDGSSSDSIENIEDLGPQYVEDECEMMKQEEVVSSEQNDEAADTSRESDLGPPSKEECGDRDDDPLPGTSTMNQDLSSLDGDGEQEAEKAVPDIPSGSDSDSDFVKLEPSNDAQMDLPVAASNMVASNMEASTSSSKSSSSISTNFRFVHPLLPPSYQVYREASDEEDSLVGDIDDRCESDISGVAEDDSMDTDMSSMNFCIGDVPLTAGRRLYKHSPNRSLNSILTTVTMAAMFLAMGIGIGHYLGVTRESTLRRLQVNKMKIAQDNHLMCLKHASIVKERLNRLKDAAQFGGGDPDISGQDLKTCGDVWRLKYENMMVQNSKLELRLQELEAQNVAKTQFQPSGCQPSSDFKDSGFDFQSYVKTLREELNKAELENGDLRREVSRLRYTAHPANSVRDSEMDEREMKLKMNQLVTENSDLKSAVGKMRYSSYALKEENDAKVAIPEPSSETFMVPCAHGNVNITLLQNELSEVNRQLTAERKLNIMLRMTLVKRNKENGTATSTEDTSSLMKCYQLLGPELVNITTAYVNMAKGSAASYISMLSNSTEESKQKFSEKWKVIVNLLEAQGTGSIQEQLGKLRAEVNEFIAMLSSKTGGSNESLSRGAVNKTAAFLKNITKPVKAHFQDYMNKTKQTVSKLSNKLQETWQVVKNLSNDFIEKHSGKVKVVKEIIVEEAKGVQNKIKDKWQTVRGKMEKNGWLKKTGNTADRQNPKHSRETKFNRGHQKQNHRHDFEKRERERREYDSQLPKESAKSFEDKPNHKQRQSNHEQYNEFWRKVDFDPDDYFHEGFFEGNQREWRKHQERLRHLHNRIHRLNEDILYSMDDDDIEDIYEDLDDLQDDMDDDDQPQDLQTWLACQVRWWKSRLQRKHRSQDLVKGCGRQIMQWQLRALCKDVCVGKRCSKKKYNLKLLPLCREFLQSQDFKYNCLKNGRVVACHGKEGNKNAQATYSSHNRPAPAQNIMSIVRDDLPEPPRHQENRKRDDDLFSMSRPEEPSLSEEEVNATQWDQMEEEEKRPSIATKTATKHPSYESDQTSKDEGETEDSSWLFERALIREYHHHNPDWLFQRAAQRDFERTKPWYVGRSEEREFLRLKHQEKQAD